jgi:hypothetical protein
MEFYYNIQWTVIDPSVSIYLSIYLSISKVPTEDETMYGN